MEEQKTKICDCNLADIIEGMRDEAGTAIITNFALNNCSIDPKYDLKDIIFERCDLSCLVLKEIIIQNVNLLDCNIDDVTIKSSAIENMEFSGCKINLTDFCDLIDVNRLIFAKSHISATVFNNLSKESSKNLGFYNCHLDKNWFLSFMISDALDSCTFSEDEFDACDFSNSIITNTSFSNVKLSFCNFCGCSIIKNKIQDTELSECKFSALTNSQQLYLVDSRFTKCSGLKHIKDGIIVVPIRDESKEVGKVKQKATKALESPKADVIDMAYTVSIKEKKSKHATRYITEGLANANI